MGLTAVTAMVDQHSHSGSSAFAMLRGYLELLLRTFRNVQHDVFGLTFLTLSLNPDSASLHVSLTL